MRREKDNQKDNWGSNPLGSPGEAEHSRRFTREFSLVEAQHVYLLQISVTRDQASLNRIRNCIISEALIKSKVRLDVTSCNLEDRSYRRFGRICCLHLQGDRGRRGKRFITFYNTAISTATDVQTVCIHLHIFRNFAHPEPAGKIAPRISSHINNSLFDPKLFYRSSHSDTLC